MRYSVEFLLNYKYYLISSLKKKFKITLSIIFIVRIKLMRKTLDPIIIQEVVFTEEIKTVRNEKISS